MEIDSVEKVNAEIASLRARGFNRDAIELVKATTSEIPDPEYRVILLVQGLIAAQALKDVAEAREFASAIIAIDPGVPSARRALGLS